MSLLQNLFDPDDSGDENPFLRDTALELDCSELEYSPRSSDIDDDDFDSIFWEGFIHAEDFNIILKPSIWFHTNPNELGNETNIGTIIMHETVPWCEEFALIDCHTVHIYLSEFIVWYL